MILSNFVKIPQSFFVPKKRQLPLQGSLWRTGASLSLRYVVVSTVSFATAFGCLSLTMQLLLFRKNHARLACSVVTPSRRLAVATNFCGLRTAARAVPTDCRCILISAKHPLLFTLLFSLFSTHMGICPTLTQKSGQHII